MSDISNLDEAGRLRRRDDPRRFDQLGNRLWHTDGSFRRVPAMLSMLYAHRVPGPSLLGDGDTEFADLRAAYDALSAATKSEIGCLVAMHDIAWSRAQLGFTDLLFGEKNALPPVPQRLVRTHPGSGRKTLYVAAHASEIVGWPIPDGRLLLRELIEHATSREFVYRHQLARGRPGDLGQSLHDASRPAFRRDPGARPPSGHHPRHRLHPGPGGLA
jgi:alpha-ketoglutarate-dependent 2,4-dichlorophenoxyacetate dioxygenase